MGDALGQGNNRTLGDALGQSKKWTLGDTLGKIKNRTIGHALEQMSNGEDAVVDVNALLSVVRFMNCWRT